METESLGMLSLETEMRPRLSSFPDLVSEDYWMPLFHWNCLLCFLPLFGLSLCTIEKDHKYRIYIGKTASKSHLKYKCNSLLPVVGIIPLVNTSDIDYPLVTPTWGG